MKKQLLILFFGVLFFSAKAQDNGIDGVYGFIPISQLLHIVNNYSEENKDAILEFAKKKKFIIENKGSYINLNDEYCFEQIFTRNTELAIAYNNVDVLSSFMSCKNSNRIAYSVITNKIFFLNGVILYLLNNGFELLGTKDNSAGYKNEATNITVELSFSSIEIGDCKTMITLMIYKYF